MKRIAVDKLWGMISRIDTVEKANIAEEFIRKCELSNDDFDELMMAISAQYRFVREIEKDKNLKPQYRRYE